KHEEIRKDGTKTTDTLSLKTRSNGGSSIDFNKLQKLLTKK
ncbi:2852_t:CDS:1, partial [Gigaspora rosea]